MKASEWNPYLVVALWNHWPLSRRFLDSFFECTAKPLRICFVDNASTDESASQLESLVGRFPQQLSWIRNPKNEGCARAWNRGIRKALEAGASVVGVLNNDVVFSPGWDRGLEDFWLSGGHQGVFSPAVLAGDLSTFHGRAEAFTRGNGKRTRAKMRSEALFIEARLFENVGFFDERFFVSFEDADFYLRLMAQGVGPVTTGKSVVWHEEKSSRKDLGQDHERQGQRIFLEKWKDPRILKASGWETSFWKRRYWRLLDRWGCL